MMRYSIEPRDQIFLKRYGFLSFGKKWVKKISKKLSGKYIKNFMLIMLHLLQMQLKNTSKRVFQRKNDRSNW